MGIAAGMLALCLLLAPRASALSGSGTSEAPYVIKTGADLAAMGEDLDGYYILGSDVNLGWTDWEPVGNEWDGPFTGVLDGQGHTITGLAVNRTDLKYAGLFGYLEGTVQNLTLEQVTVTGARFAGGVAGTVGVGGRVLDCTVASGQVSVSGSVLWVSAGGIAGVCDGEINRCSNGAAVESSASSAEAYAGGMAGRLTEPLEAEDCHNWGTICAYYDYYYRNFLTYSGGLFGRNEDVLTVTSVSNRGTIAEAYHSGGIVGMSAEINITDASNYGAISAIYDAGGLIGQGKANIHQSYNHGSVRNGTYAGGLIGTSSYSGIENSYNSGRVYYAEYTGGLIGYGLHDTILNCYNDGAIEISNDTSKSYVGGLVGSGSSIKIINCINKGTVSGYYSTHKIGGLAGSGSGSISNSYNSGKVTGYDPGGILGDGRSFDLYDCGNYGTSLYAFSNYSSVDFHNCFNLGDSSGIRYAVLNIAAQKANSDTPFNLSPDGLFLTGYYCSDIRVKSMEDIPSNAVGRSLEELQKPESYNASWAIGSTWLIDNEKNSGLPMPADVPVDYFNESLLLLTPGETAQLTEPFPVERWESDDGSVAFCEDGLVTANTLGATVISAWSVEARRANCIVFVYEPREAVSFSSPEVTMTAGASLILTTDVPAQDPQGMIWSSSNPSVATVDQTGAVSGKMPGTAIITVELPLSGVSASCEVTVIGAAATKVALSNLTVNVGETATILRTLTPAYADPTLTWSSSDPSVATVDEAGVVTGHKVGSAIVTATAASGVSGTCTVTVKKPSQTLTLDANDLTLEVGITHQLTAILEPADTTDTLTWSSSSTSVVTVKDGLLTPVKAGTALISVRSTSGLTASCNVRVVAKRVLPQSVTLRQTAAAMAVGEKLQLTAEVLPSNTTEPGLTWSSSAPDIVSVSASGVLEALAPGAAEIRVETVNGLYDLCQVKVAVTSSAGFVLGNSRAKSGATAQTQVQIVKNPGIAAFTLAVDYDAVALHPVSVEAGDCLSSGTLTSNLDTLAEGEPLRLTWYSATDTTANGLAFTITWETAGAAQTVPVSLTYTHSDLCNSSQAEVRFSVQPGSVTILERAVGDIYYDEVVNMKDIVYFARWFNHQEELDALQRLSADVYFDSVLDVKDLSALAQLLNSSLDATETVQLLTEPDYTFTVSDAAIDDDGAGSFTVSGAGESGLAAFRFLLRLPGGYVVDRVTPGAALPEDAGFSYNAQTGIVSWYSENTETLAGALFTVALHTDSAVPASGQIVLDYDRADFFTVEHYAPVSIAVQNGLVLDKETVSVADASIQGGYLTITLHNPAGQPVTLAAAYYQNGRMVSIQLRQSYTAQVCTVPLPDSAWEQCRVFLLQPGTFIPLSAVYSLER